MRLPRTLLLLSFYLPGLVAVAQVSPVGSAARSDSIDILHTWLELDLTGTSNGVVHGAATITFTPRTAGITQLPLDLLLPTDSVVMDGAQLTFSQADEVLSVNLPAAYGPGDTLMATVFYGGDPPTDPSGFGGFYTSSNYQYDLGVAFEAVPHSYGRAWFPCFDNFVERCSFDLLVHTSGGRSVFANGTLIDVSELGNGERISHWRLNEPIPAYLASVAAGQYTALLDSFPSVAGHDVPVILAALPGDTAQMRASFSHLQDAFDTFEQWFGPYRWPRVGYVLTSAGAMEHATNICYPDFAADGTLEYEDLIAHELSHHWFGNLITCARPEEMYINEGFADFCAMLFIEGLYGPAEYKATVRSNHRRVITMAHVLDEGWFALDGVPSNMTYGETTYKKGADVARTLRAVMGDSLFSAGMKAVLAGNAYTAMSSAAFRDSLGAATGLDLHDFFNGWVMQPGGAAFMVDSFQVVPSGGTFNVQLYVRQKTRGGADFFEGVPVSVTCIGPAGQRFRQIATFGGEHSTAAITVPFAPSAVRLNDDERLALATTLDTLVVTTTGQRFLSYADVRLITDALPAPTEVRMEEFWVPADPDPDGAFFVSPDRWWRMEADLQPGTDMALRITVDGRPGFSSAFDQGLMQDVNGVAFHEDSLVVLWRPDARWPWSEKPATVTTSGSPTDKYARLDMPGFVPGDYTIAWRTSPTGITPHSGPGHGWHYYPDPASDHVMVIPPDSNLPRGTVLSVHDLGGRVLLHHALLPGANRIDMSQMPAQSLLLSVTRPGMRPIPLGPLRLVH